MTGFGKSIWVLEKMILKLEDIHAYYENSYILQGVSLEVPECSVIGLLGRNGAGKTTLIQSIVGFTSIRKGRIIFKGDDITHFPTHKIARAGIGLVPQERRIFSSLSVRENLVVSTAGRSAGTWNIDNALELFPVLKARASRPAGKLSGGEQQMLSIARCLVGNPDLLLMDEPTEGLAPLLVKEVKATLEDLRDKGLSILVAEQNLGFVLDLAHHIYIITSGQVVYDSTPGELRQNDEVKNLYLGV